MNETSLISIVMPAYNVSQFIREALDSIMVQTYKNWELIVVDDCSSDGTLQIVSEYTQRDNRVKSYQLERNSGSAKFPRDMAVSYAKGDLICWVDADDIIVPEYLEKLVRVKNEKKANIVCSTMCAFESENISVVKYYLPDPAYNLYQTLPGCEAVMYTIGPSWRLNANGWLCDKSLWEKTSTYLDREKVWMNIDDLSTRELLLMAERVAFSDVIYYYRIHCSSITKNISPKLFDILYTDIEVCDLFERKFGKSSFQYKTARRQFYNHIIALNWKRKQSERLLNRDDNLLVSSILKTAYNSISYADILESKLGLKKTAILLLLTIKNRCE